MSKTAYRAGGYLSVGIAFLLMIIWIILATLGTAADILLVFCYSLLLIGLVIAVIGTLKYGSAV